MEANVTWFLGILCIILWITGTFTQSTTQAPAQECVCSCIKSEIPATEEEVKKLGEQEAEKIKEELVVDKTVLSATVRKKKSAEDDRPSAQNVGYMGIAMLSMSLGIILFMDIPYVIQIGHSFYLSAKQLLTPGRID